MFAGKNAAWLTAVVVLTLSICASIDADVRGRIEAGSPAATQMATAKTEKAQLKARHPKAVAKLRGPLVEIMDAQVRGGSAQAAERAKALGLKAPGGSAVLVGVPDMGASAADLAVAMTIRGAQVIRQGNGYVKARVPLSVLQTLANDVPQLGYLYAPKPPKPHVVSEGIANDTGMNAADWHSRGLLGTGVKIAVIDLGFIGLSNLKTAGELPASAVAVDFSGTGLEADTEHGCGVAEVVHDMAPGAELYLLKVGDNTDLLEAKDYCKANGIKVINHSVGWETFNFYDGMAYSSVQPSPVAVADDAAASNILWMNSSGNGRREHSLITWNDPESDDILNWDSTGANLNQIGYVPEGYPIVMFVVWNAWPTTDQDFDAYLYHWNGSAWEYATHSSNWQTGTQPPEEYLSYTVPTGKSGYYGYIIQKWSATTSPTFIIRTWYQEPNFSGYNTLMNTAVAPGSIGCPADAASVMAVGAIDYTTYRTGPIESFSSIGPNNRAYTGGTAVVKPDICGPDGVSTVTYGGSSFYGTSASSPHMAGAAALVWQANPSFTAAQVRAYLETGGENPDLGAAGKDNEYGYGPCVLATNVFSISGYVRGSGGAGVSGVAVSADNGGGSGTTNSSGYYELTVPGDWSGTVTPTKTGYTFSPTSRLYENVVGNLTDQDFGVATGFTDAPTTSIPAVRGEMAWGDYDNDGDMDLALVGNNTTTWFGRIYRNDAGAFYDIGAPLPILSGATCAWCDYDNDGDLDLAISGAIAPSGRCTRVYRNNGGDSFADIGAPLLDLESGDIAWGDYNNDGYADLAVCGRTGECGSPSCVYTKLFRNVAGTGGQRTFEDSGISFVGATDGSAISWADYDNDGDLDLAVMGALGGGSGRDGYMGKLYRNNGDETFTDTGQPIPAGNWGSMDWGDYDGDGDLDLAICGGYWGTDLIWYPYTQVLRNDDGTLVDTQTPLAQVQGMVAWGDFDNDGDLDLVVTGAAGTHGQGQPPSGGWIGELYVNSGGTFTSSGLSLAACTNGSARFGDYDNDGDMDLLLHGWNGTTDVCKLYRNDRAAANTPPSVPAGLSANTDCTTGSATFSWTAATDAETFASGLSYNLRVGTAPGDDDVFCGMADLSTGLRRIPAIGNAQKRLSWTVKGLTTGGTYYWSVQAIDSCYAGSAWAAESTAVLAGPANDNFADAILLTGPSGKTTGTNVCATAEPYEPGHWNGSYHSAWWNWTAPADACVALDTIGSDFDTVLAVYTGDSLETLTLVGRDDDAGDGLCSRLGFHASAGTTYRIAVDGYNEYRYGNIVLNWRQTPTSANDDFADAVEIPGEWTPTMGFEGYSGCATVESGEPNHAGRPAMHSLWWRWTPAVSGGMVAIETSGSDFDTTLAVYTGSSVGSLTEVASNDNTAWTGQSLVTFYPAAGTTYHIAVDGSSSGGWGNVKLHVLRATDLMIAKHFGDGTHVWVGESVSAAWPDWFYIESAQRNCGLRVGTPYYFAPTAGRVVEVMGWLATNAHGEKGLLAFVWQEVGQRTTQPLGMTNRFIGGGDWFHNLLTGEGQRGVTGGIGQNNVGLLIRTTGKVTQVGEDYLYIDDGSTLRDGTFTGDEENVGVRVICDPSGYQADDYLVVTGISSMWYGGRVIIPTEIAEW